MCSGSRSELQRAENLKPKPRRRSLRRIVLIAGLLSLLAPAPTAVAEEPTVLSSTPPDAPAMTEEIFGPVLPVTTFTDVADAIAVANSVELGLTAFVWTTDLRTAFSVSDALEYGMVGINDWYPVTAEAPFGGVKASGLGRESGSEGVLEYLESKTRYFGGVT